MRNPRDSIGRDLYVVSADQVGVVKIGRSNDCAARLRDLQTGSPVPLVLARAFGGCGESESLVHRLFSAQRSHGEWFRATGPLQRFIDESAKLPPRVTRVEFDACAMATAFGLPYEPGRTARVPWPETPETLAFFRSGSLGRLLQEKRLGAR